MPRGRGVVGRAIRIGRYGEDAMPRIEGDGTQKDVVLFRNMDELEVSDLEVTNRGDDGTRGLEGGEEQP